MLVEGNTEKLSVPILFRTCGININKDNISIIECGSKTQIPFFAKIAQAFDIPFVILTDEDVIDPKLETDPKKVENRKQANETSVKRNTELVALAGKDNVYFLKPDFEAEMGLPDGDRTKVDEAVARTAALSKKEIPQPFVDAIGMMAKI